jgi:hypothetical protein
MNEYLVGIVYHEPKSYELWRKGVIEDYESSTGIFIYAESDEMALSWGEVIASALFKLVNPTEIKTWKEFGYDCWIEDEEHSNWKQSFGFFQRVKYEELPIMELMGTDAYTNWLKDSN